MHFFQHSPGVTTWVLKIIFWCGTVWIPPVVTPESLVQICSAVWPPTDHRHHQLFLVFFGFPPDHPSNIFIIIILAPFETSLISLQSRSRCTSSPWSCPCGTGTARAATSASNPAPSRLKTRVLLLIRIYSSVNGMQDVIELAAPEARQYVFILFENRRRRSKRLRLAVQLYRTDADVCVYRTDSGQVDRQVTR